MCIIRKTIVIIELMIKTNKNNGMNDNDDKKGKKGINLKYL